ncbi:hypothetical protein THRCLA_02385 [Thraustotheca clavata]|uniref:Poly(A) RNA polymerase mitochondrial-like central palm domain-containing protein n=1 Tax=Thraustotheca clavata TaxID=74557 RepID=A0A1W0A5J4_9STRA|nr:hypothetical protein THRCLA_02385 [Thraustotheca clavata]
MERDQQLCDAQTRQLEIERKKQYEEVLEVERCQRELRRVDEEALERRRAQHARMHALLKENVLVQKAKEKARQLDQLQDVKMMEEYARKLDKEEEDRLKALQHKLGRQDRLDKGGAITIHEQMRQKALEDDKRAEKYQRQKLEADIERELREARERKSEAMDRSKYLTYQHDHDEEMEYSRKYQQEGDNALREVRKKQEAIKTRNKDYQSLLLHQMDEQKSKRPTTLKAMNSREKSLNAVILRKIDDENIGQKVIAKLTICCLHQNITMDEVVRAKAKGHSGPRKRRPKNRSKKRNASLGDEMALNTSCDLPDERSKLSPAAKPFSPSSPIHDPATDDSGAAQSMEIEAASRAYWVEWAIDAAEKERARRLELLAEIQLAEDAERQRRQKWAVRAIEAEQQSRTAGMFLEAMQNTAWFQATISPSFLDYEVVCPHSWFGCSYSCMLRHVEDHLRVCPYRQVPDTTELVSEPIDLNSYDIVCPNAILGCKVICTRDRLAEHLLVCSVIRSPEAEYEERMNKRETVIQASEDERLRRMHETKPWPLSELQRLYTSQEAILQQRLHAEIQAFADHTTASLDEARIHRVLAHLQAIACSVWPRVDVEPYGSFTTKLNGPSSDVDVVVGYLGDAPPVIVPPFDVELLANAISLYPSERISFTNMQALPHANIPLLKVVVTIEPDVSIPLDITFWNPNHFGLASAALSTQLCNELPGLREVTLVLKYFLSKRGMNDVYRGGLSSYGLLLMVAHVMLLHQPKAELSMQDIENPVIASSIVEWQQRRGTHIGMEVTSRATKTSSSLGKLFMDVLQYYGNDFQPEVDAVTVLAFTPPCEAWNTLYIQDPLHPNNNVGRNCYRISHILRSFNDCLNYLTSLIVRGNDEKYESILDHILNGPIAKT